MSDALRAEFVRLLTEDGGTRDRRRKEFNQALFIKDGWAEGEPVWTSISLDMVLEKFDKAVKNVGS